MILSQNKKAFTLIELLIVIAIIGILAGVVLVSTSSGRDKAKMAKALSALKSVASAADACVASGGTLNTPPTGNSSNPGTIICAGGTETLPDLTSTGFRYCTLGCYGAWQAGNIYRISAFSDAFSGGRRIILCASDRDGSGWETPAITQFNFLGKVGCATFRF